MGHWIRRKDFIQQFFSSKFQWVIREHPNWLAPIESAETLSTMDLMEYDLQRGFLMLAEMSPFEQGWRESRRWVLVNDDWGMNLIS